MQYQLITYDVWGNKRDGYEVNQSYTSDTIIDLEPTDYYDDTIIKKLKEVGLLSKHAKNSKYDIDGEFDYTLYVNYTPVMYPVCELRPCTIQKTN